MGIVEYIPAILLLIAVVFLIICIIKKAFKLVIALVVLSVLLGVAQGALSTVAEKYSLNVEGTKVEYKIDGKEGTIDFSEIDQVVVDKTDKGSKITFQSNQGFQYSVEIPTAVWSAFVKSKFEEAGANIVQAE